MKRSTIVATVAAVAVVGGAAVASASLTGTGGGSTTAQELQAAADAKQAESADGGDRASDADPAPAGGAADSRSDEAGGHPGVAAEVIATALRAAPGHVIEVDLDDDDQHWDVEVAGDDGREHELEISLDGTEVLQHEREREDDIRAKHRLLADAEVQAVDAARIAVDRLGGQVTDIDLDDDDRVWEVEVRDADGLEWDLDVDLRTGEIRDLEQDD